MQDFINYLKDEGKSDNTIKNYTNDLKNFFVCFGEFNRENVLSYKSQLESKNINAKTINRTLSSLKKYSNFLGVGNIIKSQDYISIQKSFSSPTTITKKDLKQFINKIKRNEPFRNYAIVVLIANTGLRISEALSIKLKDLKNLTRGEIIVSRGKGSKQREITVNQPAINAIEEYLKNHRDKYKYAGISEYLFVSNKGEKLVPRAIESVFNKYSSDITPHSLRHLFATNALEKGILNIRQLQEQLGHSNLNTVLVYTHPTRDAMRKKLNMKEACFC